MTQPQLSIGQTVTLHVPENKVLHDRRCTVVELTDYGAVVNTDVGTGQFRALYEEMVVDGIGTMIVEGLSELAQDLSEGKINGKYRVTKMYGVRGVPQSNGYAKSPIPPSLSRERSMGYTGDICSTCQGCRMIRSGACLRCEDCGSTSGCG